LTLWTALDVSNLAGFGQAVLSRYIARDYLRRHDARFDRKVNQPLEHSLCSDAEMTSCHDESRGLPYLRAPNSIQVQTFKHVVYLSGDVSTELMSRTAAEIAHGTPSVERVVNTVSVTK
jgi:hypothetical protein